MFWDHIEPVITPRLEAAVDRSYEVFGKYQLRGTIVHCDCNVCMSQDHARLLSSLPLKEVSSSLLAEYTNSAHGYDVEVIEPEFKYFLPRYFELIANCEPPSHLDLDVCLVRLDGYRERWPANEMEIINEFFDAFLEASVFQLKLLKWPVGYRLEYDLSEVLGMVILAGGDLKRVLEVFDRSPDPEAAVHMASLRHNLTTMNGDPFFTNEMCRDKKEAGFIIGEFLYRTEIDERILKATELLDDPLYDDVLELGMIGC